MCWCRSLQQLLFVNRIPLWPYLLGSSTDLPCIVLQCAVGDACLLPRQLAAPVNEPLQPVRVWQGVWQQCCAWGCGFFDAAAQGLPVAQMAGVLALTGLAQQLQGFITRLAVTVWQALSRLPQPVGGPCWVQPPR